MPSEIIINNEVTAASTWFETSWSASINYSDCKDLDIVLGSGDLQLHYGPDLIVGDYSNGRIVRTTMKGGRWTSFGTLGSGKGQFMYPYGIAHDNITGYIYVADTLNHRIVKTNLNGTVWTTYGTWGTGMGQFNTPRGISLDRNTGYIYVTDTGNSRIVRTKINGNGWTTYGSFGNGQGYFYAPWG